MLCPACVQAVAVTLANVLAFTGLFYIWQARRAMSPSSPHLGHWAPAASEDLFTAASRNLCSIQTAVIAFQLYFVLPGVPLYFASQYLSPNPDVVAYRSYVCCPKSNPYGVWTEECSTLCKHGHLTFWPFVMYGCLASVVLGGALPQVAPPVMWGPVSIRAAKKTGDRDFLRLFKAVDVWLLMGPWCSGSLFFGIGSVSLKEPYTSPRTWEIVFVINCTLGAMSLVFWIWTTTWEQQKRALLLPLSFVRHWRGEAVKTGKIFCNPFLGYESWRQQYLLLLQICATAQTIGNTTAEDWVGLSVFGWSARICSLIALLLCGDKPATFDDLERDGAAMGLVLNARQLRKALKAHLAGRSVERIRIERYKASFLRMQETLAVSYRWQATMVQLAEGTEVNMSRWQLESLLDSIKKARPLYVWLDKCCVPQTTHLELKGTLLARMMAVYGTAPVTVALLTAEEERNRYHQVGGTCLPLAGSCLPSTNASVGSDALL